MLYKLRDAIGIIILISSRACEMLITGIVYYRAPFAINPEIYPTYCLPIIFLQMSICTVQRYILTALKTLIAHYFYIAFSNNGQSRAYCDLRAGFGKRGVKAELVQGRAEDTILGTGGQV